MMYGNTDGRSNTTMYGVLAAMSIGGLFYGFLLGAENQAQNDAKAKSRIEVKAEKMPERPYKLREAVAETDSCVEDGARDAARDSMLELIK